MPYEPGKVKVNKSTDAIDRDYGLDLSSYKDMNKIKSGDTSKPKRDIDYSKISSEEQLIYDSYGNAVNKAKGIDYSKIPTDDQLADDVTDKVIDKAKDIDYNKIYDSYGFEVSSDYEKQDKIDEEVRDYLKRSAKQVVYGNYTDDVTTLGTAGQIGLGLTGLDFAADIRDLVYDFSNWEWTGKHVGQTILDIIGLVPGIGVVKNIDEAAGLVKNVIKNADLEEKAAKNVLDKVDELMPTLKRSMDSPSIAPLLGNVMKSSDEAAGVGKKVVKSGDEIVPRKIYTPVEYKGTVKVNGEVKDVSRRVYQRNDIDINYFDETTGLTNLERMKAGKPPIGYDGSPVELHHVLQQEVGPMAEIREITHQAYYSQLHGLIENGSSFRNDIVLNKQYNNFRYNYWKWRASQIIGGK